jgi:hypothetical protein
VLSFDQQKWIACRQTQGSAAIFIQKEHICTSGGGELIGCLYFSKGKYHEHWTSVNQIMLMLKEYEEVKLIKQV